MLTLQVPREALEPTLPDGTTPNPVYDQLVTFALRKTYGKRSADYTIVAEDDEIPTSILNKILQAGGEVYGFAVWFELTPAEYAGTVPSVLPFSSDMEGTPYTWAQWKDETHEHLNIAGKWYVGGNSATGEELTGTQIKAAIQAGLTWKSKAQIEAIIAANTPAP